MTYCTAYSQFYVNVDQWWYSGRCLKEGLINIEPIFLEHKEIP